jgi:hypothetical protein
VTSLREIVLGKLVQGRAVLEELLRGDDWESSAIEWQKGYVKALEEVLDLEGLSLRRFPRRLTVIPARVVRPDKGGQIGDGTIVDLSAGGCRLATTMDITKGEVVEVTFTLPRGEAPLRLEGWVRRAQWVEQELRVGLEFKDPPPSVFETLQAFCAPEGPAEARPAG